jgi:hypothetical protein
MVVIKAPAATRSPKSLRRRRRKSNFKLNINKQNLGVDGAVPAGCRSYTYQPRFSEANTGGAGPEASPPAVCMYTRLTPVLSPRMLEHVDHELSQ